MNCRLQELISAFKRHRIDAFLVTKDINITYLTEFPASESWLLITPQKSFYVTDFRYILEAQKGLRGITIKRYRISFFDTVFELAKSLKIARIGFDDRHISVSAFKKLQKVSQRCIKWVPWNNAVEDLREIKSTRELAQIKKAIRLNLEAYRFLKGIVKPGKSEKQLLLELERYIKGKGACFSFNPIIASGPNSCFPHAKVTDRKIHHNEVVLIDMGIDIGGYKSDLTRMFFLGRIPRRVREIRSVVETAQQKAIEKIKAGVLAHEVDRAARNYLEKNKLGKFFGHSLGHGVGLEIHEGPTISSKSSSILKEGMIFTVEPAVYLPAQFGIRIEDMVLVTKNGCHVLSYDDGRRIENIKVDFDGVID